MQCKESLCGEEAGGETTPAPYISQGSFLIMLLEKCFDQSKYLL